MAQASSVHANVVLHRFNASTTLERHSRPIASNSHQLQVSDEGVAVSAVPADLGYHGPIFQPSLLDFAVRSGKNRRHGNVADNLKLPVSKMQHDYGLLSMDSSTRWKGALSSPCFYIFARKLQIVSSSRACQTKISLALFLPSPSATAWP
jgi:hypothetical protein